MEAQGIAVAEAVGLPFSLKRVRVKGVLRFLPARLQIYLPPERLLNFVTSNKPLVAPWPRLVISIGRRSVPIALAVKRVSGAFGFHIQNPKVPPQLFDLVAAPVHDNFDGPNVVTTFGAVHSVTGARLAEARGASHRAWIPCLIRVSRCCLAARALPSASGLSLPPRLAPSSPPSPGRTAARCSSLPRAARVPTRSPHLPPQSRTCRTSCGTAPGDNPYFAFLDLADAIVATEDSVNMVTEAAGTGKPVYVQALKGSSRRLARFHALMQERGATRRFEGKLERWAYAPINDTQVVASAIRRALRLETKA